MRAVLLNSLAAAFWMPNLARVAIYRACGLDVTWGAQINPSVVIRGTRLRIGRGSTINFRCVIDCREPVVIGERCGIGIGVQLITSTHDPSNPHVRAGDGIRKPIRIKDGTWIGSGAIILPGVTIEKGCVIAAGAVVTRNCEPHGLYAGAPATRKRELAH